MSSNHSGNLLNQVTFEEHDGTLNAKKVSIVSGATIYAVVNTGAAGQGNVTLDPGSKTQIVGNLTLSDPKGFIGLVTVVGSLSPAAGNVTLDAGSKTQIIGNLTLSDPKGFIGLVTVVGSLSAAAGNVTLDPGSKTGIVGNVTLTDSKAYIGLVTATIGNNPILGAGVNSIGFASVTPVAAWPDPKTYIGLVTITGSLSAAAGNITLDPGSLTGIKGNLTLSDSKGFIGLTTVNIGSSNTVVLGSGVQNVGFASVTPVQAWPDPKGYIGLVTITGSLAAAAGNVTLDAGSKTGIVGNLTLTDSKGYIGLVTIGGGLSNVAVVGNVTISGTSNVAVIGNVTLSGTANVAVIGNVTLTDSKGYIGLVTVTQASSARTITGNLTIDSIANPIALKGNLTIDSIANPIALKGNLTLSDSKGFIGLVTIGGGLSNVAIVGNVTISGTSNVAVLGNVTLSDSKGFIGLVTAIQTYGSGSTVFTGIISASGNTTILTPPSNLRFFIKNLLITSLGRAEVEVRSGATTIIPFTSLSTTSGYFAPFGEMGLPARSQNDTLVIGLNGNATIGYSANVRFEA